MAGGIDPPVDNAHLILVDCVDLPQLANSFKYPPAASHFLEGEVREDIPPLFDQFRPLFPSAP